MNITVVVSFRLFVFLSSALSMVGCADTPRSPSVRDAPVSATLLKDTKSMGTAWEKEFGLVQATRAGGMIFLSGQNSVDEKGTLVGKGNMEAQLHQAYANIAKVLQQFTLTMNDVLEETLYVTDMQAALNAGPKVRRENSGREV